MQNLTTPEAALGWFVQRAQRDLRWSRIFLYIGIAVDVLFCVILLIAFIASLGQTGGSAATSNSGSSIAVSLLLVVVGLVYTPYWAWANYWGWVTVWRWYWYPRRGDTGALLAMIALIVLTGGGVLLLVSIVANVYGILGGGIYQYLKAKEVMAVAAARAGAAHVNAPRG